MSILRESQVDTFDKKKLGEWDICTKFITPAIEAAGSNKQTQFREEATFTDGQVIVRGKLVTRGEKQRAHYTLCYKPNIPIAVIEAKDNNHAVGAGVQQALDYAKILDVPFAFSSNGDGRPPHVPLRRVGGEAGPDPIRQREAHGSDRASSSGDVTWRRSGRKRARRCLHCGRSTAEPPSMKMSSHPSVEEKA